MTSRSSAAAASRVALVGQVANEGVEQRRARHRRGDPRVLDRVGVVGVQRARVAAAEQRLELAELRRLEAAGGLEPIAEGLELARRHRLQHVDLRDHRLEDREHALEGVERVRRVAVLQAALQVRALVQELLEPQLVDLVDDDEQELVVLGGARPLGAQHVVEREVRRVRQRSPLIAHGALVTASKCRCALGAERRVEPVEQRDSLGAKTRRVHQLVRELGVERREAAEHVHEPGAQPERLVLVGGSGGR